MSRWFRHYAGLVRDDKLVRVALHAKQPVERVIWVYSAILESAAEIDDEGRFEIDPGEAAWFLRCKQPHIDAIISGLTALGRISDGCVSTWSKRQFKNDSSNDRVKRYREARKRAGLIAQWQPTKELRAEIYDADGHQCVYCGSDDDLTVDHKIPEMHGGTNDRENLHTACRKCNAKKRDLTHDEFVTRNAVTVTVTRHRTENREQSITLANANGTVVPLDSDKRFWDSAKSFLRAEVKGDPGALIGRWIKLHGKAETISAIGRAQVERPVQAVPFIEGCFKQQAKQAVSEYGPC